MSSEIHYADELIGPINEVRATFLCWLAQTYVMLLADAGVYGGAIFDGWPEHWWGRTWLIVLAPLTVWVFLRAAWTMVIVEKDDAITIQNFWVTHVVPWANVQKISMDWYYLLKGWVQCVSLHAELPSEGGGRVVEIKLKATAGMWKHLRTPLVQKLEEMAIKHGAELDEAVYVFGGFKPNDKKLPVSTPSPVPEASKGHFPKEASLGLEKESKPSRSPLYVFLVALLVVVGALSLLAGILLAMDSGPQWLWQAQAGLLGTTAVIWFALRKGPPLRKNPWRKGVVRR